MTKELERDLGLLEVMAISVGAMVGSGIFILPALAVGKAGPSLIFAYLLAGVLVLPAALSKAEMATALPEAGGTYVYIERGMGPLLGTIAGIGTWFALSFKGALALVGGVPYLLYRFSVPVDPTVVALVLAVVLIVVNVFGAKQTGRLQVAIVVVMLAAMVWFVGGGGGSVQSGRYEPFFAGGLDGLFAVTALVFVSYAGVTKIASVAEEVEDPGRVIPLGMLGSLAFTTALYVLVVAVLIGVSPTGTIDGAAAPVADAASAALGEAGVVAVVLAALLALVSTANAGLLSSSRYPFAMSRDGLVPASFSEVSDRFGTPVTAIAFTGLVLLALVAFVPILSIAKLASAFQILVFVLINVALIAFRTSDPDWYDPPFTAPLYPWVQVFGVVSGLALLSVMGAVALGGSVLIVAGGLAWYFVYVRDRVDREGLAAGVVRDQVRERIAAPVAGTVGGEPAGDGTAEGEYGVLVAVTEGTDETTERRLLRVAAGLARGDGVGVTVVQFDAVPDQTPLDHAVGELSDADAAFEERIDALAADVDVPISYGEVVTHDRRHGIVNFARHRSASTLVLARDPAGLRSFGVGNDVDWIRRHAPCSVVLVDPDDGRDGELDFPVAPSETPG
jgi:amino acid transporter